jgi:hypothetical protein
MFHASIQYGHIVSYCDSVVIASYCDSLYIVFCAYSGSMVLHIWFFWLFEQFGSAYSVIFGHIRSYSVLFGHIRSYSVSFGFEI